MNIGLLCLVAWFVFGVVGYTWLAWSAAHAPTGPDEWD